MGRLTLRTSYISLVRKKYICKLYKQDEYFNTVLQYSVWLVTEFYKDEKNMDRVLLFCTDSCNPNLKHIYLYLPLVRFLEELETGDFTPTNSPTLYGKISS